MENKNFFLSNVNMSNSKIKAKNIPDINGLSLAIMEICYICKNYYDLDQLHRGTENLMNSLSDLTYKDIDPKTLAFNTGWSIKDARTHLQEFIVHLNIAEIKPIEQKASNPQFTSWMLLRDLLFTLNNFPVRKNSFMSDIVDLNYLEAFINSYYPDFQSLKYQPTDLLLAHKQNIDFYRQNDQEHFLSIREKLVNSSIWFIYQLFKVVDSLLELTLDFSKELVVSTAKTFQEKFGTININNLQLIEAF